MSTTIFADGRHKWGGTIYAIHTDRRIALGVVKKMPTTWTATRPDQQYLVNDWTLPRMTDGKPTDSVTYYRTRALAMAKIDAIRAAVLEGAVR